ncbi:hypothetical protein AVEN_91586-1, partial [Araneus ventricosus]
VSKVCKVKQFWFTLALWFGIRHDDTNFIPSAPQTRILDSPLPFPLLLFIEEGMRKGTKSSLFSAFTLTRIDAVQGKNNFVVVDGGHLLHKVVWQRNMNFADIAKSYLTYLQIHYGSNVAVVLMDILLM